MYGNVCIVLYVRRYADDTACMVVPAQDKGTCNTAAAAVVAAATAVSTFFAQLQHAQPASCRNSNLSAT